MLSTTLVFRESSNLMILLHEYYTLSHEEDKKKIPSPVTMKQAGYGLLNSKEKSQRVLSPLWHELEAELFRQLPAGSD